MSVFSRRETQNRLNSIAPIVGIKKLRDLVKTLNIEGSKSNEKRIIESLGHSWEVSIVSAFAKLGDTKYEKKISNGKRPDISYCDSDTPLIAEVFAVSDDQQHKKNPVEEFSFILIKLWRELGPPKGGFSWRVESVDLEPTVAPQTDSPFWQIHLSTKLRPINRGKLQRIMLPPLEFLDEYLLGKISPFFKELRDSPDNPNFLLVNEKFNQDIRVRFSIAYNPKGSGISGSHASYTTVSDIESHVLWRRLNDKKKQFSLANEESPRVLFVCDAGCAALKDSAGKGKGGRSCRKCFTNQLICETSYLCRD